MTERTALIKDLVDAAHRDIETVRSILARHPYLVDEICASAGEPALLAAAHMGANAIMRYLLASGARHSVFAAVALGDVEQVKAFLGKDPGLARARHPHGFPLAFFAQRSGNPAMVELVAALSVPGGESPGTEKP
jgi:hypothetical protein